MISLDNVTLRMVGRTLIEKLSLTLHERHRYGIVGRNGTGKSTFFKMLLGELQPDDGSLEIPARVRLGHVAQETPSGSATPLEVVMAADQERLALLAQLEDPDAADAMADIYDRLIAIDAFSAESRAASILSGLGFSQTMQHTPLSAFSGGWRMRVALASVLFSQPEWLLLDEPTNHLDLEAALWLEDYLKKYPHSLLIISHDRHLLNNVCDKMLLLHGGKMQAFEGNYDTFVRTWEAQRASLRAQHVQQEMKRSHMQAFVDRFRAKATKAKQAQSRLKALERMEELPPLTDDALVRFDLPQPDQLAPPLIVLDQVGVGYETGPLILKNLSQRIDAEDRIALLGANGNGKSTFAKLIAGRLNPHVGEIRRSGKLKVGYFAQHQVEEFDLETTGFQHVLDRAPQQSITQARAHLGRFGLSGTRADVLVKHLSGGEKARLNLALICLDKPHILILDEPTNHLDMDSRHALMMALNAFQGAVILITHDWDLLSSTVDRLWLVADQKAEVFEGDLEDYRRLLLKKTAPFVPTEKRKPETKNALEKEQKKILLEAERLVDKVSGALQQVLKKLEDPGLYVNRGDAVEALLAEKKELETQLKNAEEAWFLAASQETSKGFLS